MKNRIESAMMAYISAGISVIPINHKSKMPAWWLLPQAVDKDGNKLYTLKKTRDDGSTYNVETTDDTGKPKRSWKPYQATIAPNDEINTWCISGIQSLAVVCGEVSGGLEILDFDNHGGETWYRQWSELAGDPVTTHNLPFQQTGGNGFQVAWRCPGAVERSQKMAWIPAPEEDAGRAVMIETRGDHAYALWAPSLHPSGRHYRILHSTLSKVPTISTELRTHLLDCARQLCQAPAEKKPPAAAGNRETRYIADGGNDVRNEFNRKYAIEEKLRDYGYTQVSGARWSRPGKEDSAGVVVFDNGKAYENSSNGAMRGDRAGKTNQPFDAFDLFVTYDYNGDFREATIAAAKELGLWVDLHTLLFVEGKDNASAIRERLFKNGWVTRGFERNRIYADGILDKGYKNILIWAYDQRVADAIARIIPGAYAFASPDGQDARTMVDDGIIDAYLSAIHADANSNYTGEVTTWIL